MKRTIQDKIYQHFSDSIELTFAKGEIIIQAGEDPNGVSLLVDGIIEQYDITPAGNKVTVNIFKSPAFFPMSWAINKTPNDYFYAALTNATLKQAEAEATVSFLRANPDVLFDLLSRVYKGTDALLKRLVISSSGIASRRLVFELLIEAYRFGTTVDHKKVVVHLKQHELAAHSGLARETINRELHKLEDKGLLRISKAGIELDIVRLEQNVDTII